MYKVLIVTVVIANGCAIHSVVAEFITERAAIEAKRLADESPRSYATLLFTPEQP